MIRIRCDLFLIVSFYVRESLNMLKFHGSTLPCPPRKKQNKTKQQAKNSNTMQTKKNTKQQKTYMQNMLTQTNIKKTKIKPTLIK